MTARCPHCGGSTDENAIVRRGNWALGPSMTYHDGEQVALPRAHSRTLYAIARANGEFVTHRDLPGCSANTLLDHIRALRRTFGDRLPVRGTGRLGFSWDARA
ncbi:helix-turn-helix domain-containing protein [Novosphingobium sp. TCA1]|uniref:helix-turn-helix domain-containing protein n=1 Tax=Novosphingobium sp. TCA1 TaxID=2682474 RepID=UPI00130CFFB0|nr:helix-turn-helix domain-containing protein [Novosphingobium sp. TCA1]GFE73474.1 hypothetical protein NTCA1_11230 [Novosphingobium sp. TCA1]